MISEQQRVIQHTINILRVPSVGSSSTVSHTDDQDPHRQHNHRRYERHHHAQIEPRGNPRQSRVNVVHVWIRRDRHCGGKKFELKPRPQLTFRVILGLQNANHDNRDDNDENGGDDGHNEIEIRDN